MDDGTTPLSTITTPELHRYHPPPRHHWREQTPSVRRMRSTKADLGEDVANCWAIFKNVAIANKILQRCHRHQRHKRLLIDKCARHSPPTHATQNGHKFTITITRWPIGSFTHSLQGGNSIPSSQDSHDHFKNPWSGSRNELCHQQGLELFLLTRLYLANKRSSFGRSLISGHY